MTGFARTEGNDQNVIWYWEIRSLNGRGLDIRTRIPSGYEALEQAIRDIFTKKLSRGNCSIGLNIKRNQFLTELKLNEGALIQVINASKKLTSLIEASPPSTDGLLGLRGVLELVEPEEDPNLVKTRHESMLSDFHKALDILIKARMDEGKRLEEAIKSQIDTIEILVEKAENSESRMPQKIQDKLNEQIKKLIDSDIQFSEDRLYQEAVIIAAKADIAEEIDRLKSHILAAKELLSSNKPVGRRLDFLTQEFNREANTICSKSNDRDISRIGLDLKTTIDQMREQVQNIE